MRNTYNLSAIAIQFDIKAVFPKITDLWIVDETAGVDLLLVLLADSGEVGQSESYFLFNLR